MMSTVIADFPSEVAAVNAVEAIKGLNFKSCIDITKQRSYSGYPCCGATVDRYSVIKTARGARLKFNTDNDFLPLVLSVIIDSGGVIQ
ncbi:MAG: hypothetical protein IJT66_07320 [Clostridia bacterium]|nr:hypothetical protein [Clostridia bacterium]